MVLGSRKPDQQVRGCDAWLTWTLCCQPRDTLGWRTQGRLPGGPLGTGPLLWGSVESLASGPLAHAQLLAEMPPCAQETPQVVVLRLHSRKSGCTGPCLSSPAPGGGQ